jgi:hypothetical protein
MKLFELSWSWYEDHDYYLFVHENKTEDDFQKDVKILLIKYGEEYLQQEDCWAGANNWIEYISTKLPELGYEHIEPINVGFWGAYIIDGDDGDDVVWGEIVGEELLQKTIHHNKKIRKEMDSKRVKK